MRTDAEYVWVIDPIDGTKAFVAGIPVFGTLIALTCKGVPVLGASLHAYELAGRLHELGVKGS